MALNRETIYAALFARFQAKLGPAGSNVIKTFSRKYKHPEDIAFVDQPALIQVAEGEHPEQAEGKPAVWTLGATLAIYLHDNVSNTADTSPETPLLNLIDAVEAALERAPGENGPLNPNERQSTTLNGLVRHVWISGTVEVYPGIDSEQSIALVPLEMLATA